LCLSSLRSHISKKMSYLVAKFLRAIDWSLILDSSSFGANSTMNFRLFEQLFSHIKPPPCFLSNSIKWNASTRNVMLLVPDIPRHLLRYLPFIGLFLISSNPIWWHIARSEQCLKSSVGKSLKVFCQTLNSFAMKIALIIGETE
jgi:hypothetical protein